jgi:hypothetical protein
VKYFMYTVRRRCGNSESTIGNACIARIRQLSRRDRTFQKATQCGRTVSKIAIGKPRPMCSATRTRFEHRRHYDLWCSIIIVLWDPYICTVIRKKRCLFIHGYQICLLYDFTTVLQGLFSVQGTAVSCKQYFIPWLQQNYSPG